MTNIFSEKILIIDFGSQYTQLIARRVRENKVYCEIHPFNMLIKDIKEFNPKGIILSGSPSSVYEKNAPICDSGIFDLNIPVLGICYGAQIITKIFGGQVEGSDKREYGYAKLKIDSKKDLFSEVSENSTDVWMSHGDKITKLPKDFEVIAHTDNSPYAAIKNKE
ncbi:glutamine-hydrolyzing GMP synthase, partial [bacterium]|nr:glutamine-hydrolyzing GMP synthase [bacterium]